MEERRFNDIAYRQFLAEEKLMGSKCKKCGARSMPPRSICSNCHGTEMEWAQWSGKGKLVAFTSTFVVPPAMAAEGYDRANPYCSGVVELEEGGRVDARIEGVDAAAPETVAIGLPVRVRFLHRGEGEARKTTLAFAPV